MAHDRSALLALAAAGPIDSYAEVLDRLRAIQAELGAGDGLAWFNRLYTEMTQAVVEAAGERRFQDPVFIERLDCRFAELYFEALAAGSTDPDAGPSAWAPLFEARQRPGLAPVQLALAGVNAHINRDLPVAIVRTFLELGREPARGTPAHADYRQIDVLLAGTLAAAKPWLLDGVLGEVERALGELDDLLALWSVERAREAAWIAAEVRWALRASPRLAQHHLEALDRMVGLAGRALLLPAHHRRLAAAPGR